MATSGYWYENGMLHMLGTQGATAVDWNTDVGAGAIKAVLTDSTPTYTHSHYSSVAGELTNGVGGYTAGGKALTSPTVGIITDTDRYVRMDADDLTWTGFSAGPARYMIVYKDTGSAATSPLICWHDFGSEQTGGGGDFTYQFSVLGGVCRVKVPHP